MPNAFQVDELDGGIALVTFNVPDKKVNTLSQGALRELAGLVGQLGKRTDLRGLLFRSGKPGQFVAGADLNDLAALAYITPEQATGALAAGHQIFSGLSRLAIPDRRPDRRQLPGRRDRAGPVHGRPAGLHGAPHPDRPAGSEDRPDPGLGRDPAAASADRPESGHRDHHLGRARLGPEGRGAGPGLRCGPGRATGRGRDAADQVPPGDRRMEGPARAAPATARAGSG